MSLAARKYLHALKTFEPVREKTNNLGFRQGQTQTGPVQLQKKARSLKLCIKVEEELNYPLAKQRR